MKQFKLSIFLVLIFSFVFSTSTYSSGKFLNATYVGVINVHQISDVNLHKTSINPGIYFLHTSLNDKPFELVFKHGQPHKPIMTGDKVVVIGLIAANTLYVENIRSLPTSVSPF